MTTVQKLVRLVRSSRISIVIKMQAFMDCSMYRVVIVQNVLQRACLIPDAHRYHSMMDAAEYVMSHALWIVPQCR